MSGITGPTNPNYHYFPDPSFDSTPRDNMNGTVHDVGVMVDDLQAKAHNINNVAYGMQLEKRGAAGDVIVAVNDLKDKSSTLKEQLAEDPSVGPGSAVDEKIDGLNGKLDELARSAKDIPDAGNVPFDHGGVGLDTDTTWSWISDWTTQLIDTYKDAIGMQ